MPQFAPTPSVQSPTAWQRLKLAIATGAALVGYKQNKTSSILRTIDDKVRELQGTPEDFGAVGDGVTNDTAAFTLARTAYNKRYHLTSGKTYVVDASPDVFADVFTAGDNVSIKIGATTYDVSNAFAGPWRYAAGSNVLLNIKHAVSGNNIIRFQDGSPGTATYFQRGLAFTNDSHYIQAQPATLNGSCDMLWQRSTLNADPAGNRFNHTFEELSDRLLLSFATSASGAPVFDTAMALYAGTSAALTFDGLRAGFLQGWYVQTRALGALKFQCVPGATQHTFSDATSGNTLGTVTRSQWRIGGIAHSNLADVPSGVVGPQRWGAVYSDLGGDGTLPSAVTFYDAAGATRNGVIGTLRVACTSSGAAGGWRESRFTFDGTTLTVTDLVNALPTGFTATVIKTGTTLQVSLAYSGATGAGYTVSVSVEFNAAGR